jgi:hypothetical protein
LLEFITVKKYKIKNNIKRFSFIFYNRNTMSEETQSKLVGKVKWFNNKAGYGFITAS